MILLIYAVLSVHSATKVSPKLDFSEAGDLVTVTKDGIKGTRIKSLKVTVDTSESRGSPGGFSYYSFPNFKSKFKKF